MVHELIVDGVSLWITLHVIFCVPREFFPAKVERDAVRGIKQRGFFILPGLQFVGVSTFLDVVFQVVWGLLLIYP